MAKTPIATSFFVPGYIPQFDGLRGIAILLVLIGHSGFLEAPPHAGMLEYTRFGVDLFFVLSGFLITGILTDSKGAQHYFRNFYARRSLRIFPLYYAVIAIYLVILPRLAPSFAAHYGHAAPQPLLFWLYLSNHAMLHGSSGVLNPTWSLGVVFSWNIFDGGNLIAAYEEAKASLGAASAQVRVAELTLIQNLEQAEIAVEAAVALAQLDRAAGRR